VADESGATAPAPRPAAALDRIAEVVAVAGGALALLMAALVAVSVTLRRTLGQPIPGDFEFIQMGVALAVFAFLPLCQARRGNIVVDTFTSMLPRRVLAAIDGLWDLVYAGCMGLIAWGMTTGAVEAFHTRTASMVLQIPLWPALSLCAALAMLLCVVCLWTAGRQLAAASRA